MSNDLISREALKDDINSLYEYDTYNEEFDAGVQSIINFIDNAPTFTPKVEFVTKNGITFPKALETMTFSHELTTEERQNIERAYMLGVYSNERPQGEWIKKVDDVGFISHICSNCGSEIEVEDPCDDKFCYSCGAEMKVIKNDNN